MPGLSSAERWASQHWALAISALSLLAKAGEDVPVIAPSGNKSKKLSGWQRDPQ